MDYQFNETIRIPYDSMVNVITRIFVSHGMRDIDAALCAETLDKCRRTRSLFPWMHADGCLLQASSGRRYLSRRAAFHHPLRWGHGSSRRKQRHGTSGKRIRHQNCH